MQLALSHACDKLGKAADHRKLLIEHAMEHAAGTLLQRGEAHVDHQRLTLTLYLTLIGTALVVNA